MAEFGIWHELETPRGTLEINPAGGGDGLYLTNVAGMDGATVRAPIEARPQADGAIAFDHFRGARYITLEGYLRATSQGGSEDLATRTVLEDRLRAYTDSILRANGTLRFAPSGQPKRRVTVRLIEQVQIRGGLLKEWQVQLVAHDPLVYSDAESAQDTTGLQPGEGSLSLPFVLPFSVGDVASGGTATVVNAGTVPTPPTVRIYGQATSPAVTNLTTGETLSLIGLSLSSGDYAEVDMAAETVTLNGDAGTSLVGSVDVPRSTFWRLEPGPNEIQLTATQFAAGAKATAVWRDGFI